MPARLPLSLLFFAFLRISSTPALVQCLHAPPSPHSEPVVEAGLTDDRVMAEPHRPALKLRGGRGERRWRYTEGGVAAAVSAQAWDPRITGH